MSASVLDRYALPERPVDRSRPFLPEGFAPLAHHQAYSLLDARQRLRYNQLYALYFNEMAIFFEDAYAESVLGAALRAGTPEPLASELRAFIEEERRHTSMFRRLNALCEPGLYRDGDHHFVHARPIGRFLLDAMNRRPGLFPLSLWVMLLMEDRSVYYSREVLKREAELEPHFVALHRVHLSDEMGHVRSDEELILRLWDRAPAPLRLANAWLLGRILAGLFSAPVRGGRRILARLAAEFPELGPSLPRLERAMAELSRDPVFLRTLFSREMTPKAFALFDCRPELRGLSRILPGYTPAPAGGPAAR